MMKSFAWAAFGAVALSFAMPAAAQDYPLVSGNYWSVSEISIDDGHFGDYADHLAGTYRKTNEFARSKGWIKNYHILSNNNKRADEPDLYLVIISDHIATPAQELAREQEMNTFLQNSPRQRDTQSGVRAKYRKVMGSMLLQELLYKK